MLHAQITLTLISELKAALKEALLEIKSCSRVEAMARGLGRFSYQDLQRALAKAPAECVVDDNAFDAYLVNHGARNFPEKSLSRAILAHAYVAKIENGVFSGYSSPVYVSPLSIEPGHGTANLVRAINHGLHLGRDPFVGMDADRFTRSQKDFFRKCLPNTAGVEFLRRKRIEFGWDTQDATACSAALLTVALETQRD